MYILYCIIHTIKQKIYIYIYIYIPARQGGQVRALLPRPRLSRKGETLGARHGCLLYSIQQLLVDLDKSRHQTKPML